MKPGEKILADNAAKVEKLYALAKKKPKIVLSYADCMGRKEVV